MAIYLIFLDVDDPLLPHEDVGRDARGVPEAVVRQVYDGEAVDLPHHGSVRIHPDDPVLEGAGQLLLVHARAVTLVLDGLNAVVLTAEYMKAHSMNVKGIIFNHYEPGSRLHEDNKNMCEYMTGLKVLACVKDGDTYLDIPFELLKSLYQ